MTDPRPAPDRGPVLLLVEDNYLVGLSLKALLETLGYTVLGPAATVAEASRLLTHSGLAGAVLDVNIRGGTSIPIATVLSNRRVPFFFVTGYASPPGVPPTLKDVPILHKPVDLDMLTSTIATTFAI